MATTYLYVIPARRPHRGGLMPTLAALLGPEGLKAYLGLR